MRILRFQLRVATKRVRLIPFGCVHFDSPQHQKALWDECLAEINKLDTCCIGMGDYLDFLRTTDRHAMRTAMVNEDYHRDVDRMVRRSVVELAEYMKKRVKNWPLKCIGLLEGNHFWTYHNGTSTTQHLCELLNVPFLQEKAWVLLGLKLHTAKETGGSRVCKLLAHHGYNISGASPALSARRMELRIAPQFDADLILSSHAHQLSVTTMPVETVTTRWTPQVVIRDKVLAKTGAFLDGNCIPGDTTYATKKLLPPLKLGFIRFTLEVSKSYNNRPNIQPLRITHEY